MQTALLQRKVNAADIPLDRLMANKQIPDKEKVQAASRAFEAVLLRQILETTQKPLIKTDLTKESASGAIYRDIITTQLADGIAKSGQFGLARSLDKDWVRQLGADSAAQAGATAGTSGNASTSATPAAVLKPYASAASLKPLFHKPDLKPFHHE
jgi:Rod binding domain-containing protein